MRSLLVAATVACAAAAQWYGMAPDNNIPGQVNIFKMDAQGRQIAGAAVVVTADDEYPKSGTLRCHWDNTGVCYFLTGVAGNEIQDTLYAVNRTSGQLVFKHVVPAGIYLDNLVLDWETNELYGVVFDPARRDARIVQWSGVTGGFAEILDITAAIEGGFVFGGAVSYCPSVKHMYISVDAAGFGRDFILHVDLSKKPAVVYLTARVLFPIPSASIAFCNATGFRAIVSDWIQSDSEARETLVIGDIQHGEEGVFLPLATGDLPTFSQRGETALFLNGMLSEFNGDFLAPIFPPFNRGPGPVPNFEGGFLWSWTYGTGVNPAIAPLNYYLAGAAGVPNQ